MRQLTSLSVSSWFGAAHTAPSPLDPSLDVAVVVQGEFVNLLTGEQRTVTIMPLLLWMAPEELPSQTETLRQWLTPKTPVDCCEEWRKWKHRTVQDLMPPRDWLFWEAGYDPLTLQLRLRDAQQRLTYVRIVTLREEQVVMATDGTVQEKVRLAPTEAAALLVQGQTEPLFALLARWTPLVSRERTGTVAEVGPLPPPSISCEECQRGEEIAYRLYPDLALPEQGFVRVYRRLHRGDPYLTDPPHFPLEHQHSVSLDIGHHQSHVRHRVEAQFVRSVPLLSQQEAIRLVWQETRWSWCHPKSSNNVQPDAWVAVSGWQVYDVQRHRYVIVIWEVQIRTDLPLPFGSESPLSKAREWSREQADALLPHLPLTPPNDVATLLTVRLRPEAEKHHIALKPVATLWFDGNAVARRFFVPNPPLPFSPEAQRLAEEQRMQQIYRAGETPLQFAWTSDDPEGQRAVLELFSHRPEEAGSLLVRWLRWLDPDRKTQPLRTQWMVSFRPPEGCQTTDAMTVFTDAEYEVTPQPPKGLQAIPPFRLKVTTQRKPASDVPVPPRILVMAQCSDPRVSLSVLWRKDTLLKFNPFNSLSQPHPLSPDSYLLIPVELVCLWRLRVGFDSVPQDGRLTITLEGDGQRWQREASVGKGWDTPPRWRFPRPDDPHLFDEDAGFYRLSPGRYILRVEGRLARNRKVSWQRTLNLRPGLEETVIVPLLR